MKLKLAIVTLAAAGACTPINQYITPHQPGVHMEPLPAADYEILGQVTGKACRSKDELKKLVAPSTHSGAGKEVDENWAQETVVYYEAKFKALESLPEADNLMYVRTRAEFEDGQICVTTRGRAYRLIQGVVKAPRKDVAPPAAPAAQ